MTYLDTHVVVWLHNGDTGLLSSRAKEAIEQNDLFISPMVQLELQYLSEIDKIKVSPHRILDSLSRDIGLSTCRKPFDRVIRQSLHYQWTRDPFDRIITAQAALDHNALLTRDESIVKHYSHAIVA